MPRHHPEAVTVVIPVFNGADFLADAVKSVVTQEVPPQSVIIVDDGSTDATPELARAVDGPIRYVRQDNAGAGSARNRGVALAETAFVAFIDADDLWMPGKLEHQLAAFRHDPDLDMVFGHVQPFVCETTPADIRARTKPPTGPIAGYHAGAMLIRRDEFNAVGPFDDRHRMGEFVEWFARARRAGKRLKLLDDIVMRRRIHGGNQGRHQASYRTDLLRTLRGVVSADRQSSNAGNSRRS